MNPCTRKLIHSLLVTPNRRQRFPSRGIPKLGDRLKEAVTNERYAAIWVDELLNCVFGISYIDNRWLAEVEVVLGFSLGNVLVR